MNLQVLSKAFKGLSVASSLRWSPAVAQVKPLATSTCLGRWHEDAVKNRKLFRYGYVDKVKQSGPLPRLSEDSPRVYTMKVYTPENPFAPKRALFGQNDYIDILGNDPDAFRPSELNYQAPEWIREVPGRNNVYQNALKRKEHLAKTSYSEMNPHSWEKLNKRIARQYKMLRKHTNQRRWTNYRGIKMGDVSSSSFATRYPF